MSRGVRNTPEIFLNGVGELYEPEPNTGCWLWLKSVNSYGYGQLFVEGKYWYAHRFMYSLVKGHPGEGVVMHICDEPSCVNPLHLVLGTDADNAQDCAAKGRHSQAKNGGLDPEKVRLIRNLVASGRSQRKVAALFGVDQSTVSLLVRGKTWKDV